MINGFLVRSANSASTIIPLLLNAQNPNHWEPRREQALGTEVAIRAPVLDLPVRQVNVLYGLLRERPDLWMEQPADTALCPDCGNPKDAIDNSVRSCWCC